MIGRRSLVAGVIASTACIAAGPLRAQTRAKRVAFIDLAGSEWIRDQLLERLRRLGWRQGENINFVEWVAPMPDDRWRVVLAELKARAYDVVTTGIMSVGLRLRDRAAATPVVMTSVVDPVAAGLAASLAAPGRNITGFYKQRDDIAAQCVALLRELAPGTATVLVAQARGIPPAIFAELHAAIERYALSAGLRTEVVTYTAVEELRHALSAHAERRDAALYLLSETLSNQGSNLMLIAEAALALRLPSVAEASNYVRLGGLLAYSASIEEQLDVIAGQIDRLLRGARPGDLPFVQPTRFSLGINLKTATTLGLTVPPHILARADRVIE